MIPSVSRSTLTELILRENGMTADIEGVAEMQQKETACRNAAAVDTDDW